MTTCALCELPAKASCKDEGKSFCCIGCQTVYKILHNKKVQGAYKEHPLYKRAVEAGIITQSSLPKEEAREESKSIFLEIGKMWCASCAQLIALVLRRTKGVLACQVDYTTDIAEIEFVPCQIGKERIIALIQSFGYEANAWCDQKEKSASRKGLVHFALALTLFFYLMMFSYPLYLSSFGFSMEGYEKAFAYLSFVIALPLMLYLLPPLWKKVRLEYRVRQFGMHTLIFLGVGSALLYSIVHLVQGLYEALYFDSMAAVMAGLFLGRYLQAKAKVSVKEKMLRLERFLPRRARIAGEGFVPIKEVKVGMRLQALAGEKIVLDGIVERGKGALDEAMLTGELAYVVKQKGDAVHAGAHLKEGNFVYRVTKAASRSTLNEMVHSIEKSLHTGDQRPYLARFLHYFVLLVLALSFATLLLTHNPMRALSLLLISCPCVIGIAKPLVDTFLIQKLSAKGLLVRNVAALFRLKQKPHFVFDKTNTLTKGKFTILSGIESVNKEEREIIGGLTSKSTHPLARCLAKAVATFRELEVQEILGEGLYGKEGVDEYRLGSLRFMKNNGIKIAPFPKSKPTATRLYFAKGKSCTHYFDLADELRVDRVEGSILSGDRKEVVEAVAKALQVSSYKGELTPQEKEKEICALKKKHGSLIMVGDGINDTLAMAKADLSCAMKESSPMALAVADLILMNSTFDSLEELFPLIQRAKKIIRQNFFWAFFYNCIGLFLALFGLLTPLMAALAMLLSTSLVIINSLRIK